MAETDEATPPFHVVADVFANRMSFSVSCREAAKEFAKPFGADFASWWAEVPRGDWMLYAAGYLGADPRTLIRAGADCARLGLRYVPEFEHQLAEGLRLIEGFLRGERTEHELRAFGEELDRCGNALSALCGQINARTAMNAVAAVGELINAPYWFFADHQANSKPLAVLQVARAATDPGLAARFEDGEDAQSRILLAAAKIVRGVVPCPSWPGPGNVRWVP